MLSRGEIGEVERCVEGRKVECRGKGRVEERGGESAMGRSPLIHCVPLRESAYPYTL